MSIDTLGIHDSVEAVFPPEELVAALSDVEADVRVVGDDPTALAGCDGIVTFAHREAFLEAELAWIHSIQAGVDRFPFGELEARGIALTNSTGIHGDGVGDTVAGMMLAFARKLHRYRSQQEASEWEWPAWDEPFTLRGQRCCVVGLGGLGRGIAARADGLGMDVVGVRRTPTPVENVDRVYPADELREAIADARFVVLAVPLTDETSGLIGAGELAAMREDAYLVNVARGGVLEQDALVRALEEGRITGAALDVFEEEPLPDESPLWGIDDVIVTPHAAAAHREYYRRIATIVRESLKRRARGEGFANRVVQLVTPARVVQLVTPARPERLRRSAATVRS